MSTATEMQIGFALARQHLRPLLERIEEVFLRPLVVRHHQYLLWRLHCEAVMESTKLQLTYKAG